MLTTLIYRSDLHHDLSADSLKKLIERARSNNESVSVTGILLFDGRTFFQILEGPRESVNATYHRICRDDRHNNFTLLLRDYAPQRRFGLTGMEIFDLRNADRADVFSAILPQRSFTSSQTYEDRPIRFLRSFLEDKNRSSYVRVAPVSKDDFYQQAIPLHDERNICPASRRWTFAFQPIVDTVEKKVIAFEALIRSPSGGSPQDLFSSMAKDELYEVDLLSKESAFIRAKQIGLVNRKVSVNLLPGSLVSLPDGVDRLLALVAAAGLVPEQVVVEVTEDEIISNFTEFQVAIDKLKAAGISLAIDDFGAGFAGLSLLSQFQPDKLKIDRKIITGIHRSGARQAIVQAILNCCASLEITVIVEGVEQVEEWAWLQAAGARYFQGFLFARPALSGEMIVHWPG